MIKILVLCTGNSCRSQMAHGYLQYFAGENALVRSAGVEKHGVNPHAIQVMQEDGIDISSHTSNRIEDYEGQEFDHVITVCDNARERCPWFPSTAQKHHKDFHDPAHAVGQADEVLPVYRDVRDALRTYCKEFVSTHIA